MRAAEFSDPFGGHSFRSTVYICERGLTGSYEMNSSELQPWTFLLPSSQSASSRTGSPTWWTSVRTTMAGNLCRVQLSTSRPLCVPSLHVCLRDNSSCNLETVPVACQSSSDQEPLDKKEFDRRKCQNL
ncbi:hypothetical protein Mapa_016292 [Marchantia paleacea]|nr:hypothetical protein Mapa_016292 [Marchantia paleacea]